MRGTSASDNLLTSPGLSADAELIRLCAKHRVNMDAFNEAEGDPGEA